jgi:hypothetical protein
MATLINQKWVFGSRAELDFSTNPPTPHGGRAINTGEGCASISDVSGNLVLYTDGQTVWDSANAIKASGLHGNTSSTQSAIVIPDPGNPQQYYIFTADGASGSNQNFNGVRIDISNPTWPQTQLSSLLTMPSMAGRSPTERVTAIQHANCVDYWVLTVVQASPSQGAPVGAGFFRIFLVNSLGVQYIGETPMNISVQDIGYLKGSPDGHRLALANWSNQNVLLYGFDNALGVVQISSLVNIPVPPIPGQPPHPRAPYGVEFSPQSNVLYYSLIGSGSGNLSNNNGYVFQVDLSVPPVSVQVVVYPNVGASYALGALQLGSDGRIYIAKPGEGSLGAILNPQGAGALCNPNMNFITLSAGTSSNLGLPNLLPNPCDCACDDDGCEKDIDHANQVLNLRGDQKAFTIVANGQSLPSTCNLAFPNVSFDPVFTLHWGDGPTDQFESNDLEVVYIRLHNPFRNLIFREVVIFNITITPNQTLPGGGDSVVIIPAQIACFDEIGPCSYVSRDFAVIIDHALVGTYHVSFDYCIGEVAIVAAKDGHAVFDINVVAS